MAIAILATRSGPRQPWPLESGNPAQTSGERSASAACALHSPRSRATLPLVTSLASIWVWLSIFLVIIVGFFIQLVLFLFTAPFDPRRRVAGRFFRLMAVFVCWVNPLWRFRVVGPVAPPSGPTVCVSNHVSNADVFLLSHFPWEMKWLGKDSLFRKPFLGWSMWLAGDIPVVRGDKLSGGAALQRCAEWVKQSMPVMIFPEGTRSLDGTLQPFKDGAFRLAVETGADLLPLAVHGTYDALPKHSWRFGRSDARARMGTPIPSAGKTAEELKAEARAQIERMTAELANPAGGAR